MSDALVATRRSWHGLAELVLAGPQYRTSGTIRLRITPGGFGTVAVPELRVDGDRLVTADSVLMLTGLTFADVAREAGITPGRPEGLYKDNSGVDPDQLVVIDPAAATHLASALARGDMALRAFAPDQTPVLWPEHFDLGVCVDGANYGVSLGDARLAEPYAYVGPWQPRTGPFWNAPFGASRPIVELGDTDAIATFFAAGRAALAG